MKQIWALVMLVVLLAASGLSCVVRNRGRGCGIGEHWNGSYCENNHGGGERRCGPAHHWDGRDCVHNGNGNGNGHHDEPPPVRVRTVGERSMLRE